MTDHRPGTETETATSTDAATGAPARTRLRYRLLTGPDDQELCARVSAAIEQGYVLNGSPSIAVGPDGPVVCQAVTIP